MASGRIGMGQSFYQGEQSGNLSGASHSYSIAVYERVILAVRQALGDSTSIAPLDIRDLACHKSLMNTLRNLVILLIASFGGVPSGDAGVLDQLDGSDVRVATHLREIDSGALAALKRSFNSEHRLADRGEQFGATDVMERGNQPSRRLVLAARAGDTWFIHYEHGGRGLHTHLVALVRSGRSWRVVHAASTSRAYETLPKLRAAVRAGTFRDASEEH